MKHKKEINDMLRYIHEKIDEHDIADDVTVSVWALRQMALYLIDIKKDLGETK